jgi:hypothetical protein
VTAGPTARGTARPRRGSPSASSSRGNQCNVRYRVETDVPCRYTVSKSRERESLWRRCTGGVASRGEALPPPRSPALQDRAACARRHPGAEPVAALAAAHVRLVGPFHRLRSLEGQPSQGRSGQYRQGVLRRVFHSERIGRGRRKRCSYGFAVAVRENEALRFHTCE